MAQSILTLILAGGEGERLSILSQVRAKPGVPFGGKYRIIDFALSNAVNSGLTDVAVLTQYAPRSLIDHIGARTPLGPRRSRGGVTLLHPTSGVAAPDWYRGTADAVLQNLEFIADRDPELVVILAATMSTRWITGRSSSAIARRTRTSPARCAPPIEEAHRFGILRPMPTVDHRLRREAGQADQQPVSMGVYVFGGRTSSVMSAERVDLGRDVLRPWSMPGVAWARITTRLLAGRWHRRDIGRTGLDLLSDHRGSTLRPGLADLHHERGARAGPDRGGARDPSTWSATAARSTARSSTASCGRGSGRAGRRRARTRIVMFDTVIGAGATVDRAILDKDCVIGPGSRSATGDDLRPNRAMSRSGSRRDHPVGKRAGYPRGSSSPQLPHRPQRRRGRLRAAQAVRSGETVIHAD